ncbi:MAG: lipocalin family protein [Opitutales bacterium]|nr:lipocalin family protein [Opitutales bacterium]
MNGWLFLKFLLFFACFAAFLYACRSFSPKVETAKNVDINKYMGTWFEIARLETPFQRGKFNSKAEYKLSGDGSVSILNSAEDKDGRKSFASARAYAPDSDDFSKLRVSFFRPFYTDYFILEIDPDYQWALVGGGGGKKYLWILSRTPELDDATLNKIITLAQSRGYDTTKLLYNSALSNPAQ